jgi:hypothetical protein
MRLTSFRVAHDCPEVGLEIGLVFLSAGNLFPVNNSNERPEFPLSVPAEASDSTRVKGSDFGKHVIRATS